MPVLSRKVSQKIFYDQKHMLFQHFLKIMIQMLHSKRLKKIYSLKNWRVLDGRREMSTACGTLKCTGDSSTEHSRTVAISPSDTQQLQWASRYLRYCGDSDQESHMIGYDSVGWKHQFYPDHVKWTRRRQIHHSGVLGASATGDFTLLIHFRER